jgi:colanic acid/amylovoran biosynthesis protein
MNILLVNFHSNLNAGDAALLEVSIRQFKRVFNSPHIIVAANWLFSPDDPTGEVEVIGSPYYLCGVGEKEKALKQIGSAIYGTVLCWLTANHLISPSNRAISKGWRRLFYAYRDADWVAAVPGNQFVSTGRFGWPFPLTALVIEFAHWFHKPLYILPQSIGPLKRKWERVILRSLYRKARLILLRDNQSLQLARQIHLPVEKVQYMADPAFGLAADDHDKAVNLLKEYGYIEGEAHLGITVISRMGHSLNQEEVSRYYTNLAGSLSSFISQHHIHVFFFGQVIGPTEIEDDRKANEIIRKRLSAEPSQVSIVDTQMTPSMLKACYGLMDLFVASRLHSGIFAISMGIPTVFIGYLHKTRGLLQALGLENWVIDLREQDDGLIRSKLESAWAERKQLSTMLFSMMPDIIKMTQEIPELIRVDYEKYLCKG